MAGVAQDPCSHLHLSLGSRSLVMRFWKQVGSKALLKQSEYLVSYGDVLRIFCSWLIVVLFVITLHDNVIYCLIYVLFVNFLIMNFH